ncbi:MAG: bifunctional folylpolyglutamate synthase/dihydrofolate synthase [Planctomycetota bacterium]|nr:bifunctional folylpolyglutamate synthase/dihydrofolate synthase [Planctomycetota bacterium]
MARNTTSPTPSTSKSTIKQGTSAKKSTPPLVDAGLTAAVESSKMRTPFSKALTYLSGRTDIERSRAVHYDEKTFQLDRMIALLGYLGKPHEQLRTVHVAGTVGKGSTVAMIAQMLEACGYTVGRYTSPHMESVCERIQINGKDISENDFATAMAKVQKAAGKLDHKITFFEAITAAAFCHFVEEAVDIVIVEVGLGGRLDSTNVITPLVSVITTIDFDHTALLGTTLGAIAREKAGIFKAGVPAIVFDPVPEVLKVFTAEAERIGAPLRVLNKDVEFSSRFCVTPELGPHTRICLYSITTRLEHLPVPLPGEHQATNCGLALAAVDALKSCGYNCPDERITHGLAAVKLSGRMEIISERPKILVDGAHNPASVAALMKCVGSHVPYDSMVCIFGCCADKDVGAMLDAMSIGADKVIFTRSVTNPRAADPVDLQRMYSERNGKMSQVSRNIKEALEIAGRAAGREDLICITGSFYVVGEAKKRFLPATQIR